MFNDITPLQSNCHKILPLVYDDSLSYYEVLCKAQQKLNELIENNNELIKQWELYKNDIDEAFGDYTAELDRKFTELSDHFSELFYRYKYEVNDEIREAFADQDRKLKAQDDKLEAQDTKIEALTDKINSFITQYNKVIAQIPTMIVDAVNAWLNDRTHYNNIIAELAGSIQGLKHFDTVADLKVATFTEIAGSEVCVCENYFPGDGVFTMWEILRMDTAPGELAEGIVRIALPHEEGDLYYRVALLRSEYTATTLGIATNPLASARAATMANCAKYNFNPIKIDHDFAVDLSAVNTTKTLAVYSDPSVKSTLTIHNGNNFISSFKDIKVMHETNNLKHNTPDGVKFENCDILAKDGATIQVCNVDINNCFINASQIQCTDEYTVNDYMFTNNTWTANTIFGLVLTNATVDSLRNCDISNNRVTNNSATRTRLFLSPNIPARNIKITNNVVYNPHVSADTPLADGIIGAFTAVGSASEFTLTVTGNTVYSSTLNTAMTLGKASDTYHKFTLMYKDNNIVVNSGTVAKPKWSSVLSTMIQTNGALYTNFIGDLDTSSEIHCQSSTYMSSDVGTRKVIPFDVSTSIGYKPQSDGTLLTQENNAYYRAELSIVLSGARGGDHGPQFATISFGYNGETTFLSGEPLEFVHTTFYISPSDIKKTNGILQLTIHSNYAIGGVNGYVKLFRLA